MSAASARVMKPLAWLLMLVGLVFVGHALSVAVMYGSFHFGLWLITAMGLGAWTLGFSLRRWGWGGVQQWLRAKTWRQWLWRWGGFAFLLWLVTVAAFFAFISSNQDILPAKMQPVETVMILGGGAPRCSVTPAVQERLDEGLRQASKWPHAKVVVTGGVVLGHPCSEASVMARYLTQHGLPSERILLEDQSTSTHLNMVLSQRVMQQRGIAPTAGLLIVTNDFHTLRSRLIALRAGFKQVASVSAPTPLYARYSAWLREYFAYISGWLLNEF